MSSVLSVLRGFEDRLRGSHSWPRCQASLSGSTVSCPAVIMYTSVLPSKQCPPSVPQGSCVLALPFDGCAGPRCSSSLSGFRNCLGFPPLALTKTWIVDFWVTLYLPRGTPPSRTLPAKMAVNSSYVNLYLGRELRIVSSSLRWCTVCSELVSIMYSAASTGTLSTLSLLSLTKTYPFHITHFSSAIGL